MKSCIHAALAALALALGGTLPLPAAAHTAEEHAQHQKQAAQAGPAKPGTVRVRFDDAALTDQNGRSLRLKSDVMGQRIVVLDFLYTTCTTVCPVLTAVLTNVQAGLDAAARSEVQFVSITVDPARDTPARLKEYADKHGATGNWAWLTGPTVRVNDVLKGFGAYSANFEDHPPLILVGDASTGEWTRFFGFADPKAVLARVQELRAARAHAAHKH